MVIVFVYIPPDSMNDLKEIFEEVRSIKENHGEKLIIIGDMNARIGDFQNPGIDELLLNNVSTATRNSNDLGINQQGKALIKEI